MISAWVRSWVGIVGFVVVMGACRPTGGQDADVLAGYPGPNPTDIKSVYSQKVLTMRNKAAKVGDLIEQRSPSGLKEQEWRFVPQGGEFYAMASSLSGMCLEIYSQDEKDRADVGQMPCNGTPKQKWQITLSPAGATLKSGWNYMCLSLAQRQKDDGVPVILDHCLNQDHQLWQWRGDASSGSSAKAQGGSEGPVLLQANTVVGVHAVTPAYQFTSTDPIVETVQRTRDLGSHIIKLDPHQKAGFEAALKLPFTHYFLWFRSSRKWLNGLTEDLKKEEYTATYHFAKQLLTNPALAGKTFFFGHWEGDWYLLGEGNGDAEPTNAGIEGMIAWLNLRQKAVDDAKRDTPQSQVRVFHYAEINRVRDVMVRRKKRMVNMVLPKLDVDYISYSAYDVQQDPPEVVNATLDYIQSQLRPRPQIPGKRVFIGEFGMSRGDKTPADQDRRNREFLHKFASWGAPYIIYWSMYETKSNMDPGRKLALIDEKNQKTPFYATLQKFFRDEGEWLKSQGTTRVSDQAVIDFVARYFR